MLLMKDPFFCDPLKDKALPVIELTNEEKPSGLSKSYYYLIGDTIYEYVGQISVSDIIPGTIGMIGEKYFVEPHEKENEEIYNAKYIISKAEYEERINHSNTLESMLQEYSRNYKTNNNLIKSGNIKIIPSGEVYIPTLDPNDDPLERVIKLMLRHMKLVLNDYRGQFDKKHGLDNIKSALNGATKNMSIIKFLSWCENFELNWEITIDNIGPHVPSPIAKPIILSNRRKYPWMEIPPETKEVFTVPLTDGEDPLKRGIKLALGEKQVDLRDYKHKSPTPHLLNNMKSALKSSQKMTLPYFMNWCEIIDLVYSFKVVSPKDGIWYKLTGFDMSTNDPEIDD